MLYLRKVTCAELNIAVVFDNQAYALKLFTKLYDGGYPRVQLEDHFVDEYVLTKTNDADFEEILNSISALIKTEKN